MYAATPLERFGGLNLHDKVDAVGPGEAIDLLNVEFTRRGAVKRRNGYEAFTGAALTNPADSLQPFYTSTGTRQLLAGCGTRLEALDENGNLLASRFPLVGGTWGFARVGTPNAEAVYAGNGNLQASGNLVRWNGSAFADIASTPAASALAVMPVSNRLVAGGFNGTNGGPTSGAGTSSPSHVYFSDPGAPETWTTNNFIQVTPGDGERVRAIIAWREQVFIFKESKFFVVYGESQNAAGQPIFDYYAVDTGVGCVGPGAVAAAETGVYFMDRKGVYRTTGNEPEVLSQPVEPIFQGGASQFFSGGNTPDFSVIDGTRVALWQNRLYVGYRTSATTGRMLVYDTNAGWWSLYSMAGKRVRSLAVFRTFTADDEALVFGIDISGANQIARHNESTADFDPDSTMAARWRGGFANYDTLDVKTVRETKIVGTGLVQTNTTTDYETSLGTLAAVSMASATNSPVTRMDRRARRGQAFSVFLTSAVGGTRWTVNQVVHHLREQGIPSRTAGSVIS